MALSIKTAEADRLARALARLTGETMTRAVTIALQERLDRERSRKRKSAGLADRVEAVAADLRRAYDTRPVTKAEWDAATGDESR